MKTIGIDIDNTITETTKVANYYLSKFTQEYSDYHELPREEYQKFLSKYLREIVKNNILKEGVKEAFEFLKKQGFRIVIITARNNLYEPLVIENTLKFLAQNSLKYDKILFDELNIGDKANQARDEKVDIFIDDKETVLDSLAKIGIECIRFSDRKSKYKTFNNWSDIIEYIVLRKE